MVKKSARKVRLALVCGAVLALAAPSSAFAQDAEATLDGDTVPAADSESGFELSFRRNQDCRPVGCQGETVSGNPCGR